MKSIYEMDMNMAMIVLAMIMVLNGYTMASVVLGLCLILTALFFTNPERKDLLKVIKMTVVYTIGVVGFIALVIPQYLATLPFVLCINGFTMFCWFNVAKQRKKIMHRMDQIALLFGLMILIFLTACWCMPIEWMVLYSPLVQPLMIRVAMSLLVVWMLLPLPLLMIYLHQARIRFKQHQLSQRIMD